MKFQGKKKQKTSKLDDFDNLLLSHPSPVVTLEANEWREVCWLTTGTKKGGGKYKVVNLFKIQNLQTVKTVTQWFEILCC